MGKEQKEITGVVTEIRVSSNAPIILGVQTPDGIKRVTMGYVAEGISPRGIEIGHANYIDWEDIAHGHTLYPFKDSIVRRANLMVMHRGQRKGRFNGGKR